ncbi:hypothetical protein AAE478_009033 [Parahypoxylon ruwenzoriense]
MNQEFCERCHELFSLENLRKVSGGTFTHGEAQTIINSARNGCPFCELMCLLQICVNWGIQDGEPLESSPEDMVWVRVRSTSEGSLIDDIEIEIENDPDIAYCRVFAAEDDPASTLTAFRPIQTDVASPGVIEAARELITSCRDSHPACHATAQPRSPSRIIDVAGLDRSLIYLRSTYNLVDIEYVALSYCWGGDQPVKLLSNSEASLENGVPFVSLPASLQDAVTCARELGYRYLWIDALCIMQDSVEDKLQELGKMASIYRDAVVTIIAASASTVSEGYLGYDRVGSVVSRSRPSKAKTGPCRVNVEFDNGQIGTLTIIPKIDGNVKSPTDKRGWCLQESILPRRLLYYGQEELLFRCQTLDCQPVMASPIDYRKGINPPRILQQRDIDRKYLWHNLVLDYSWRNISVEADKVYAIAGIIEELQRDWTDECFFGIWRSRFLEELCWSSRKQPSVRPRYAPSWSWMCMSAGVDTDRRDWDNVDAALNMISGGAIELTCRIMTTSHPARSPAAIADWKRPRISWRPDLGIDANEEEGGRVDYLYIGSATWENEYTKKKSKAANIAIAVVELEGSVYRRVGLVEQYMGTKTAYTSNIWMQCPRKRVMLI